MTKNLGGDRIGATGRDKLMAAALHLAATTRSLASLGLREVARHAGLNPNTFYRHFRDFDDLGLAVIEKLAGELRQGLRERRTRPVDRDIPVDPAQALQHAQKVVRESITLVLDFVTEHREAYVVGIRELHGSSPVLRRALRSVLDDIALDMAEDVIDVMQVKWLDVAQVRELSQLVIRQMTFFSLDYLEQPDQREAIRAQAERFILLLFWGALAAKNPQLIAAARLKFPYP